MRSLGEVGPPPREGNAVEKARTEVRDVRSSIFAVFVALVATASFAQETPPKSHLELPKGLTMWGLGGNVGFPTGDRSNLFGTVIIDFERVATDPGGPGWLRGQLGYSIELVPVFLISEGTTAYGAGFNLLGRHYLAAGRAFRPFITLGAGLVVSNEKIPPNVANLNFTPQVGFGYLFSDRLLNVYSLEVRFHHLSNGGLESPNPGINSVVVQFGVRFHAAVPSADRLPSLLGR
jgi:Lipid A 3-O-deacylase (PagL)